MAVSNDEINAYLAANPGMSDADIAAAMNQYGVTPEQMSQATGLGQDVVQSRFDAAQPTAATPSGPLSSNLISGAAPAPINAAPTASNVPLPFQSYEAPRTVEVQADNYFGDPDTSMAAPVVFSPDITSRTVDQKADELNKLLAQGFSNAEIKAAADAAFGVQPDSDWNYLTNLANSRAFDEQQAFSNDLVQPTTTPLTSASTVVTQDAGSNLDNLSGALNVNSSMDSIGVNLGADLQAAQDQAAQAAADAQAAQAKADADAAAQATADAEAANRAGAEQFTEYMTNKFGGLTPDDESLLAGFKYAKDRGISNDSLRQTLGEDLYNTYEQSLTDFAVTNLTNIVADNQLTWNESQLIHNFGRDLGFSSEDLARMTGQDVALFNLADTNYRTGRDQIINGTFSNPDVQTDADRIIAAIALEKQFGFTDDEFAQATGLDPAVVKAQLDPVRNFETDFNAVFQSSDTTTSQAKEAIANGRSNAAINKLYGDSLNTFETTLQGLENKWVDYGTDALQAENLFKQLSGQRDALGGEFYRGRFGDLMNSAALLANKGLDTINDLGQKDKFESTQATTRHTTADGRSVQKLSDGRFYEVLDSGESTEYREIPADQVQTAYGRMEVGEGNDEAGYTYNFVPLTGDELSTLQDGSYQKKIGTVVIDKDTGNELTGIDGVLLYQSSSSRKHFLKAQFTPEGVPILTASEEKRGLNAFVSDLAPMVLTIASFIPGPHQPFARLANAAIALEQKNYIGAVLSGISAFGSFTGNELATLRAADAAGQTVDGIRVFELQNTMANIKLAQTFAQGAAALQAENIPGLINAGISAYAQLGDSTLPSGVTTAVQLGNFGIALSNGQVDVALNSLGDLTGSNDFRIAGSAVTLIDALQKYNETGDISGVINAGFGLAEAVKAGPSALPDKDTKTSTTTSTTTTSETTDNAGVDAFTAAKNAGATDQEAMDAANAVTGVVVNKIPDSGPSNVVTTTFDDEFGNLGRAQLDATARNTVAIGSGEADNVDEAAYLAKIRNPSGTSFTFDGKTYTMSASQSQMDAAIRTADLADIQNTQSFGDAFAKARDLLGPNQTFEWQGKQYSTATASERPDLSGPSKVTSTVRDYVADQLAGRFNDPLMNPADLSADSLRDFTKAYANATTAQQAAMRNGVDGATYNVIDTLLKQTAAVNPTGVVTDRAPDSGTVDLKTFESTGFFDSLKTGLMKGVNYTNDTANDWLINNPNSPLTRSMSIAFEAAGELVKNMGGAALAFDNKPLSDLLVNAGDYAQDFGQSLGIAPQDTKNWQDTVDLIDKAEGFEKVVVVVGRALDGKSGLSRQGLLELAQEAPALFLGATSFKAFLLASGAIEVADTGGAAVLDAFDDVIKNNGTYQEALLAGRKAGGAAAATEAVIQLTLGKIADVAAGKINEIITKSTTKLAGESVVEGLQEGAASLAVNFALGQDFDVNKALTGAVVGAAVGPSATVNTAPVDAALTINATDAATTAANTAATANISNNINTAITSGNPANISSVITENVTTSLASGAGPAVVIDSAITSAITGGADAAAAINNTVTAAINSGADLSIVLNSTVTSAITAGANLNTAVGSVVTSAINSGANLSTVVNSTVTSAITAGASVNAAVDSAITAAVNAGGNLTVAVDSAVTSVVNSGGNVAAAVDSSVAAVVNAGGNVNTAVEAAVTGVVNSGGNVTVAVDSAVTAAVNAGSNVTVAVDAAVNAAVNAGANVDTTLAAAVSSAVNAGTNVNTVVDAATNAATNTGNNVTVAADTNTVTITNATTNTNTVVDVNSGVTTTVDANNNVTTVVDGNITTTVDANSNTTSQTTVDPNANTQTTVIADTNNNTNTQTVVDTNANTTTSTTVDTNNNTTTQTTIDANTQTTVLTNIDTNTQTTVNINIDTGEIYTVVETEIPKDWEQPVIEAPKVPDAPVKPEEKPKPPAVIPQLNALNDERRPSGGGGQPTAMNLSGDPLRSRVTEGAIDPLARVKQAQAELEREVMMNQIDPRLLGVIQQRMDPQQQSQQFDKDIGALAKMLGGDFSQPSNEGKYYSYGSEDSIDDILGGRAASFKEGGFVEPLKASGSMALPLMAKSGGALGKYDGREDFKDGKHVAGEGDGQSDDIPAWLADGEFVVPSDVVSALGNGSSKAGTDKLYEMMHSVRERARSTGPKNLPPPALKSPLDYMKKGNKK